mmetsp:Transcript_6614/g.21356  ORF Transcript_6614/g.21356 Transcript_6614/m.21356 type:complete len:113 (-) Transcript_6614:250-588(-)
MRRGCLGLPLFSPKLAPPHSVLHCLGTPGGGLRFTMWFTHTCRLRGRLKLFTQGGYWPHTTNERDFQLVCGLMESAKGEETHANGERQTENRNKQWVQDEARAIAKLHAAVM